MRPRARRPHLIAVAALGLFALQAEAQMAERLGGVPTVTTGDGGDGIDALAIAQFSVVGSIQLSPLSASELLLGASGSTVDLGTWFPGADPTAGATLNSTVVRSADPIWSAWFTQQPNNTNNIDVQLSITGLDGSAGYLTHETISSSRIAVTLLPGTPVIVESQKSRRLIQGGVQFVLDCTLATNPGPYGGQLVVTVNQL